MMSAGAWAEPIPDYGSIIRQIEGKVKRFSTVSRARQVPHQSPEQGHKTSRDGAGKPRSETGKNRHKPMK